MNNLIAPTVYEGQYNALVRSITERLLPTLREHGIRLYAWSPAAGGVLGNRRRQTTDSRIGAALRSIYATDSFNKTLEEFHATAQKHGLSGHEVALRWLRWHSELDGSKGDGIVFGARTLEQTKGTLEALKTEKGPLPQELVEAVEMCYEAVKDKVPYFSPFKGEAWARQ